MLTIRPRTLPPQLWTPILRAFSSTPTRSAVRGKATKTLPVFDWRRPYKHFPKPSVTLIHEEAAANTYLESLTSKRLSIEADGGAKDHPSGFTRETSYSEGALAIADGEGVMILHLARMKRAPAVLIDILNDPSIEKQKFGVYRFMKDITERDADFFPSCHPQNFLDLRALSINLHPRLEQVKNGTSLAEFRVEHAKDALGMQLDSQVTAREHYGMQKLGTNAIDTLVNETWITHIGGSLLRTRLEAKIHQALTKDVPEFKNKLPNPEEQGMLMRMIVEKTLASYRYNLEDFDER